MKMVLVEWLDSHGEVGGWQFIEKTDQPKPVICESVGFLMYEGKDCIKIIPHLAGHTNDDNVPSQGRGAMTIPTVCVRRLVTLTVKKGA